MKAYRRHWKTAKGLTREAWVVDVPDPTTGRTRRRTLRGCSSRKEADQAVALIVAEQARRALLGPDAGPSLEERTMTLGDLLDEHLRRVGVTDGTRRLEEQKIATVVRFLGRESTVATLSTRDIERYKAGRLREGATAGTVNRELAIVRAALNRAHDDGRLSKVPLKIRKLPTTEPRRRFLSREESEALVEALKEDQETREVAVFVLNTALRPSELWRTCWGDVDWDRELLIVETRKAGRSGSVRRDSVPLNSASLSVLSDRLARLDAQPSQGALVFGVPPTRRRAPRNGLKRRGGPGTHAGAEFLGQHRINDRIKRAAKAAGIRDPQEITLYTLRHSAATACYNASGSIVQTQRLLRHRSPMLTLSTYTHATEHEVRATAEQIAVGGPARIIPVEPIEEAG